MPKVVHCVVFQRIHIAIRCGSNCYSNRRLTRHLRFSEDPAASRRKYSFSSRSYKFSSISKRGSTTSLQCIAPSITTALSMATPDPSSTRLFCFRFGRFHDLYEFTVLLTPLSWCTHSMTPSPPCGQTSIRGEFRVTRQPPMERKAGGGDRHRHVIERLESNSWTVI